MYQPQIGDALELLDTPSMLVDLTLMEANIASMMQRLQARKVHVRPHLKTVKSPALARKLLAAGAIGGCVAKVSEAEVMADAGIEDLLITTEIIGQPKLARLVSLIQKHPALKVVVDSLAGAQALHQILAEARLEINVLLDLNVGQNRCGVNPGADARTLAHHIGTLSQLHLIGVQGYEGHLQHIHNPEERAQRCRQAMQILVETATQLRTDGFPIDIVTTGGTGTAEICAEVDGVTEVQPGSFIFMDTDYHHALGSSYANALTILSTVISRPTPTRAVVDAGLKSLSTDSGMPELKGQDDIAYHPGGDEHGILTSTDNATVPLEIGDRLEFIPSHIDTTINLHDYYYAHRNGILEAIWPVATRGKVQ
ncbi:alanine racemase [Dictyobacter alpinus]|uniref:Alanine racemase n=1 Tax=Dictyobacter alpinus TaxID=2014873 RepID=A0A402B0D9_9CHLR|nr:DSD1 family PLP-dependent enzyme [Dictyobacter alpinus]GCE24814.1 alanine racemase [Dictyobacter alpinus]